MKHYVLSLADLQNMSPILRNELWGSGASRWLMRVLAIDRINALYDRCRDSLGWHFARAVLDDMNILLNVTLEARVEEFLFSNGGNVNSLCTKGLNVESVHNLCDSIFPQNNREEATMLGTNSSFITVSNHPFGALDGIALLSLFGAMYDSFRVFANVMLMHIDSMQSCFIPVNPMVETSADAMNRQAIKQAMTLLRNGTPIGIFPAGSVSVLHANGRIYDMPWQNALIRLIQWSDVPILPVYFEGNNTLMYHLLGLINWRLRTIRLPYEVFRKSNRALHVIVRSPIMPKDIRRFQEPEQLGRFLQRACYGQI